MRRTALHSHVTKRVLIPAIFVALGIHLGGCNSDKKSTFSNYAKFIDTTVVTYGSYIAVKLPITRGVKISNPIQIALGPEGIMYAANQTGEVYTLHDTNGDGLEDSTALYCNVKDFGLRSPSGFTYRGDTIYIGTAQQIRAFYDRNGDGRADTSWVFFDKIPHSEHPYEWTNGLTFGSDGWLYFTLTTDSWNAAPSPDPNGYRGAILKVSPDGSRIVRVATGIRSVYDMSFNQQGDLFFTDNEGGGNPTEELNRVVPNAFYGHNPAKYKVDSVTRPAVELTTEVAPSGIEFNKPENDFGGTGGDLFIAFYGPGERWARGSVGRIRIKQQPDGSYTYQEFPVADIPKLSNLAFGKDGSLYLASHGKTDYWYNAIYENQGSFYKVIYDPSIEVAKTTKEKSDRVFSESSLEEGRRLFAEQACLGCHQVDGVTELLGPNLKDVAKRLTREEILEEILKPSERIKPSMGAQRIVKKDGQVLIGRVINTDEYQLTLMLVGNHIVKVPRNEIEKTEDDKKSLMYEGLLNGLSETERASLLDYIISLSN